MNKCTNNTDMDTATNPLLERRIETTGWEALIDDALRIHAAHGTQVAGHYLRTYGVDLRTACRVLATRRRRSVLTDT